MSKREIIRCDGCGGDAELCRCEPARDMKLAKEALQDVLAFVRTEAVRIEHLYGRSANVAVRMRSLSERAEDLPKVRRALA